MRSAQAFVLLVLCTLAWYARAHEDTELHLSSDGSIRGLAPQYESTRLKIEYADDASGRPTKMTFISGGKQTVVERCVLQRLPAGSWRQLSLSGSWYHDKASLPDYVGVQFETPGQSPNLPMPLGLWFLFSLPDAKLIVIKETLPTARPTEVRSHIISNRAGCPKQ